MAAGLVLYTVVTRNNLDAESKQRAAGIASSVGDMPSIVSALRNGDPRKQIRVTAAQVRRDTGASYVVVVNAGGIRYSHPNAALIGQRIEEPVVALDGHVHVGVDNGSLGRSANARAPIRDQAGIPIGEVSVGILETDVTADLRRTLAAIALSSLLVFALAVIASLILARTIRRVTFGLEPAEIVALVQEREAMLHGIREGVIGFDGQGRMKVINDEARRLLAVPKARLGQPLDEMVSSGRLRDVLSGSATGRDLIAVTDDHLLVINRMPVRVSGRDAGSVATIRDRTEFEDLLRQLESIQALTTALRAQEHEYSNRLHVMSALLELEEFEEVTTYAAQLAASATSAAEAVQARIAPATVAALLTAKITVAGERDVEVLLDPRSQLEGSGRNYRVLLTVLGNLVDNAVDAIADAPYEGSALPRGRVTVELYGDANGARLVVSDTGPGIPPNRLEHVFVDGYSTKKPRGAMHRGIGLALVHRLVRRAGGTIGVTSPHGARFEIYLPLRATEEPQ